MPDADVAEYRTTYGAYRRLTEAAIARAADLADTDEERAKHMGVSRRTYYRMLRGDTDTPLSIAAKVAKVLGLTVDTAFWKPES